MKQVPYWGYTFICSSHYNNWLPGRPGAKKLCTLGLASLSFTFTVSQILSGKIFLDINSIKSFYDDRGWGNIQSVLRSAACWKMPNCVWNNWVFNFLVRIKIPLRNKMSTVWSQRMFAVIWLESFVFQCANQKYRV